MTLYLDNASNKFIFMRYLIKYSFFLVTGKKSYSDSICIATSVIFVSYILWQVKLNTQIKLIFDHLVHKCVTTDK